MSSAINGVDVSSWNHPNGKPIDWDKVADAGYYFAVIKATQGTGYVNPWIVRDIQDANAAGLLVGAYHYYEAGEDPAAQAKWFTSNLIMQQLDLGVFVDWECYLPVPFTRTQELTSFLTEARLSRPQTGVYCSADWAVFLEKESVHVGRLWLSAPVNDLRPACFMQQVIRSGGVDGIPAEVDEDIISNTRGLDIPTSPPERPNPNTAHSLKAMVDDEAEAVEAETEQAHDGDS